MKYKVGDKVRVKSLEWFNANKIVDSYGHWSVEVNENDGNKESFVEEMTGYCGKEATIAAIVNDSYSYRIDIGGPTGWNWTDSMFE